MLLYLRANKLACHTVMDAGKKTQGCCVRDKGMCYFTVTTKQDYHHLFSSHRVTQRIPRVPARSGWAEKGVFDERGTTSLGNPNLFNGPTFAVEKIIIFTVLDTKEIWHFLRRDTYICLSRSLAIHSRKDNSDQKQSVPIARQLKCAKDLQRTVSQYKQQLLNSVSEN